MYVLFAILRKHLNLQHSPYTILQILRIILFKKTPTSQALSHNPILHDPPDLDNHLCFLGSNRPSVGSDG